jgi:predicted ArsR family transcriptional regulator
VKFPGEAAERVARALLQSGSATASELAEALGMTPAGIRRHLAALVDEGLVVAHDRAPYGPTPKRGRGRPGSVFSLTPAGRSACDQAYDDLALAALRFLAEEFGPEAVEATPEDVARTLTRAGYAAAIEPLGAVSVQLCQHNCPVLEAAREFPVLCEAETAELGRVMGRHVTRLATLAHGDEICTAVIAPDSRHHDLPAPTSIRTRRKASA